MMTLEELEKEVKQLKEEAAEGRYARDYLEICQVQSMYSHLYHIGMREEIPALFARKNPQINMEIEDSGVYIGLESITRFWNTVFSRKAHMTAGFLAVHMTMNPVIEINQERTQAKGLWHSHGFATLRMDGRLTPFLCLGKYDMEYVREDGRWKIFKFAYRQTFMSPFEKGWVAEPVAGSIAGSPENRPDRPTTYHMPYSPYRINIMQPPPPEPYD
ncbi:MAG: nuclear transport factor 2 family protein [Dehalococcoidales bacterium]|nr:nuclear transport factor 2 family protein [Dehalococcoidales bacterium]